MSHSDQRDLFPNLPLSQDCKLKGKNEYLPDLCISRISNICWQIMSAYRYSLRVFWIINELITKTLNIHWRQVHASLKLKPQSINNKDSQKMMRKKDLNGCKMWLSEESQFSFFWRKSRVVVLLLNTSFFNTKKEEYLKSMPLTQHRSLHIVNTH